MVKTSIVKSFLKQTPIYLSAIVLGIILGMAIQMAYAAWTNPTTFPPNNNAPAPINVSTTTQTKTGSFIVATASGSYLGIGNNAYRLEKNGDSLAFVNKGGETKMIIGNNGNVGIGTMSPRNKLELSEGGLRIGGGQNLQGWPVNNNIHGSDAAVLFPTYTGGETSDLRLYITDNGDDRFSIWGDTCSGGDCGDVSKAVEAHRFTANGDVYHRGNVGIGITAPTQKLDVNGYVKGRSGLCIGNDCKTSWPSGGHQYTVRSNLGSWGPYANTDGPCPAPSCPAGYSEVTHWYIRDHIFVRGHGWNSQCYTQTLCSK